VLLVAVDATVLSFALPSISEALQPSGTQLLWMIDIYPLVLAGLLVSMGSFADRVGRRRLLLIGSIGFAVVSVIAAYAPTAEALIASRAALGFFGAMLMPSTLSLLRRPRPDRRRVPARALLVGFGVPDGRAGPGAAARPGADLRAGIQGPDTRSGRRGQHRPVAGHHDADRLRHQEHRS
jgi:MFS family permease